jgi:transposase
MDKLPPEVELSEGVTPAPATPFSQELVTITKAEHVQLVWEARHYKRMHQAAVARIEALQSDHRQELQAVREAAALREQELLQKLQKAEARAKDLADRHFNKTSERGSVVDKRYRGAKGQQRRKRGQQPGAPSRGRTMVKGLEVREEFVPVPCTECPKCGKAVKELSDTEDCEVMEVEVRAYVRKIRRRRARPTCDCGVLPGNIIAPPVPRLIPRGKLGISVYVDALVDKFEHGRASFRWLAHWANLGAKIAPGTLCGGFQQIRPLFAPLYQACLPQLRSDKRWNADETRWEVFVEREGKKGHRWYLWVFRSPTVVYFVLDPSRSAEVIEAVLEGVTEGVIICDRYSAYKKFARLHPGIWLAFCWSHQRRDFLKLANSYPQLESWALDWVDRIGELFKLYDLRVAQAPDSEVYLQLQGQLRSGLHSLTLERLRQLADPKLAAPARKVLASMKRHWRGLREFVRHKDVPPDNNGGERVLRGPVTGRKNYYGSGSEWSGQLAAMMFTLMASMKAWGINVRTWLTDYLNACAAAGNCVPADLKPFLPWSMDAERLAKMRGLPPEPHKSTQPVTQDTS